jgi:hypothetical protein
MTLLTRLSDLLARLAGWSAWAKATASYETGACAECRRRGRTIQLRDTENRRAGHLSFDATEWAALVHALRP